MVKYYHPYVSDKPKYKFYIIKNNNKRLYFGDSNYEHYTEGHLDEIRKNNYINRHSKREDFGDYNTKGFWSMWYLWYFKTYKKALDFIKTIIN
jgi:hypothetical protein